MTASFPPDEVPDEPSLDRINQEFESSFKHSFGGSGTAVDCGDAHDTEQTAARTKLLSSPDKLTADALRLKIREIKQFHGTALGKPDVVVNPKKLDQIWLQQFLEREAQLDLK